MTITAYNILDNSDRHAPSSQQTTAQS